MGAIVFRLRLSGGSVNLHPPILELVVLLLGGISLLIIFLFSARLVFILFVVLSAGCALLGCLLALSLLLGRRRGRERAHKQPNSNETAAR